MNINYMNKVAASFADRTKEPSPWAGVRAVLVGLKNPPNHPGAARILMAAVETLGGLLAAIFPESAAAI